MPSLWSIWFAEGVLANGRADAADGAVQTIGQDGDVVFAEVGKSKVYSVEIALDEFRLVAGKLLVESLESFCTCNIGVKCRHAVAALIFFERHAEEQLAAQGVAPKPVKLSAPAPLKPAEPLKEPPKPKVPLAPEEIAPVERYESSCFAKADAAVIAVLAGPTRVAAPAPKRKPSTQQLVYVLDRSSLDQVSIVLATGRRLKNGQWREVKARSDPLDLLSRPPVYMDAGDRLIVAQLVAEGEWEPSGEPTVTLGASSRASELIDRMAATGRLLLGTVMHSTIDQDAILALRTGDERTIAPTWDSCPDETWQLRLAPGEPMQVVACSPPHWISGQVIGPLVTTLDAGRLAHAVGLPPLEAATAHAVARALGIPPPPAAAPHATPCVPVARVWRTRIAPTYGGNGQPTTIDVVTLLFRYGDRTLRAHETGLRAGKDGPLRDQEVERRVMAAARDCGVIALARWNDYPWRITDRAALEHVSHAIAPRVPSDHYATLPPHTPLPPGVLPALIQAGWRIERHDGTAQQRTIIDGEALIAQVDEADDHDWFQLHLGLDIDGTRVDLVPVLAGLVAGGDQAFAALEHDSADRLCVLVPLGDGRLMRLGEDRLRRLASFIGALFAGGGAGDGLGITPDALLAVDDLSDVLPRWLGADRLRALADRLRPLLKPGEMDPPAGFTGALRPYQRHGLAWLQRLREAGAGGVLADDMGLGKTVQVLAHLAIEHAAGRLDKPVLVVAPASVAPNWVREAKRFVPGLRAVFRHGNDRHALDHTTVDLVVTTYGTLLRDSEAMAAQEWSTLICDEAQFIKNANAKAAQAVRALKARSRLSLTGTPVENHLGELWAQMHWLNPGLLGNHKRFEESFRTPIEKGGDLKRLDLLQRRIAPFLLRRTKAVVATDLPAKTSTVLAVRLDGAQRDLYEAVRAAMDERLVQALAEKGLNRSRIDVLDALLKLRQCCCDPRLVKAKGARAVKESAKLDALAELLPTLIEDGRRVLIFSQFTSMLDLIDERLGELDIARVMLTGETPVPKRQELVDRFQRGEVPVFLISLKAGGTGLNLTSADTVVLYDPWWNPAVEDQAIDRAHRIGQDKPVFVYRLVAQGTVEERMISLQARKRALADSLYGDEERVAGDLSEADLAALLAPIDG